MKILVTGATGFLGKELVKELVKKKYSLRCLVRNDVRLPKEVEKWKGDLTKPDSLNGICDGIDVVIHLAAKLGPEEMTRENYAQFKKINVVGTKNLLEESARSNIGYFINFSSIAVYGIMADRINLNKNKYNPKTPYERTKYEAEKLCNNYSGKFGFKLVNIRPSMVYDFSEPKENIKLLFRMVKIGFVPLIGNGSNIINLINRKFLIKKTIEIIEKRKIGTFIMNEENVTMDKLVDKIARHLGKRHYLKIHIPIFVLYLLADISEKMDALGINPPLTRYRLKYISSTLK